MKTTPWHKVLNWGWAFTNFKPMPFILQYMKMLNAKLGERAIRFCAIVLLKFHDVNLNSLFVTKNLHHDSRNSNSKAYLFSKPTNVIHWSNQNIKEPYSWVVVLWQCWSWHRKLLVISLSIKICTVYLFFCLSVCLSTDQNVFAKPWLHILLRAYERVL